MSRNYLDWLLAAPWKKKSKEIRDLKYAEQVLADLAKAEFVLANSAEVGVPRSLLPLLAALKGAGAAGLLVPRDR